MRLLLANGIQVSVETYTSTTTVVNGNTVPALSIVVNESLDRVKSLFSEESNLVDFNIYEDDKSVVLIHAIGYQKRVSISLGDSDDQYTVLLAKTSETDVVLEQVQKSLTTLESKQSDTDSSITSIRESLDIISKAITNNNDAIKTIGENFTNVMATLKTYGESIVSLTNGQKENSEAINSVNNAVAEFQTSITQFTAMVDGFKQATASAQSATAQAATSLDAVNKAYTIQAASIERISSESSQAVQFVQNNKDAINNSVTAIETLSSTVANAQKQAADAVSETARLSKAYNALSSDQSVLKANVSNTMNSVNNAASTAKSAQQAVDDAAKKIETLTKDTDQLKQDQADTSKALSSVKSTVSSVSSTATNAASVAQNALEKARALEPVKDYTTLSLEDAKKFRIAQSASALEEYLAANPITSTCHGGEEAQYSITKEKQSYLNAMITMATLAAQNGTEYQCSWNATGEVCTYDWTVEELSQLAMEIEAVVRPLVSYQQTIEKEINAATTMEELSAIVISYNPDEEPVAETVTPEETTTEETAEEAAPTEETTSEE